MKSPEKSSFRQVIDMFSIKRPWDSVIIGSLCVLLAVPLFIIAHQNLIDPEWWMSIDRIVLFIAIVTALFFLLRLLKRIIILALIGYLLLLIYGSTLGDYGFMDVYEDYRSMVYMMADDPNPQGIIISKLLPFPNKTSIIRGVNYKNPTVRNFAVMATTKHFKGVKGYGGYRQLIQCFAVFKEINSRWTYVNDPRGRDYIARADESVLLLAGDCDDHAILMAAGVKAIGGTPRLIHTTGHIYPEILIGKKSDLETINYLVKKVLFPKESEGHELHYHIDEYGQVWLNLDYTAKYPGGRFMREEILGELTLY
jgi:hypothetical protein